MRTILFIYFPKLWLGLRVCVYLYILSLFVVSCSAPLPIYFLSACLCLLFSLQSSSIVPLTAISTTSSRLTIQSATHDLQPLFHPSIYLFIQPRIYLIDSQCSCLFLFLYLFLFVYTLILSLSTSACCVRPFLYLVDIPLYMYLIPEPRLPFYFVSTYLPIP